MEMVTMQEQAREKRERDERRKKPVKNKLPPQPKVVEEND
jgi:hypothetical protein